MKNTSLNLQLKVSIVLSLIMFQMTCIVFADIVYQDDPDIPDAWQGACVSVKFGSQQAALDYDGKIDTPYTGNVIYGPFTTSDGYILADVTGASGGQIKCKTTMYNHIYSPTSTPVNLGVSAQTLKPFSVSGAGVVATSVQIDFDGLMVTNEPSANAANWVKSRVEYLAEIQQYNSGSGEREIVGSNTFDGVAWIQESGGGSPTINIPATYVWMEGEGAQANSWDGNANLQVKKVVTGAAGGGEVNIDTLGGDAKTQAQAHIDAGRNVYYLVYSETFNFNANAGETYYLYMDLQSTVESSSGDWETMYALSDFSNTIDFTLSAGGSTITTEMQLNTTQTVSGDNPFGGSSSDVTLENATLDFSGNASLTENLALVAGSQSTINTNTNTATLTGSISGTGNLRKTGTGALQITGTNPSTGTLSIENGRGILNGSWGGNVSVESGSALQGTGTIGGDLNVAGLIQPGNSIGTLPVAGNYTQATGSTLEVEFNNHGGVGNIDRINATGSATIQSGTTLIPLPEERITQDLTYTFIQAAGGISGDFTTLVDNFGILDFNLQKAAGGTEYQLVIDRLQYASQAQNPNQQAVARALDATFNDGTSGDLTTVLAGLDTLTESQLQSAYNSLIPTIASNMGLVARSDQYLFARHIENHLSQARTATQRISVQLTGKPKVSSMFNGDQEKLMSLVSNVNSKSDNWLYYAHSINSIGSLDSYQSVDGLNWYSAGFATGADVVSTENCIVGITAGGLWSSLDGEDRTGSGEISGVKSALYASVFNEKIFFDTTVGYGHNWNEYDRPIDYLGRVAHGKWDSDIVNIGIGGGYNFDIGGLRVTPVLTGQYLMLYDQPYHESGADTAGLYVDSEATHSLRHQLGLQLTYNFIVCKNICFKPIFDAYWIHEYLDRGVDKTARLGYGRFTTTGVEPDRESVLLGTGFDIAYNDSLAFDFAYDTEFANHKTEHYLHGGVKLSF